MISRLLLTTAIGLALGTTVPGTSAFAQSAVDNQPTINAAAATPTFILSDGVNVSQQDRARIGESVARMNVKSLRGVDFSVAVGSRVPRELRVYRLPAETTQIVAQYRDYRFLVVEKDIVIVEPKANKIVTILKLDTAATPSTAVTNAAPVAPTSVAPTVVAPTPVAPVAAAPAPAAPPVATTPTAVPAPVAAAPDKPSTPPTSTQVTAAPEAQPATAAAPKTAEQPSAPVRDSAADAERPKAKKQASRTQRRTVNRAERDEWRRSNAEVRVGQRVPDDVVLYRVPPRYYQEVPVAREYYRSRGYVGNWRGRPIYQEFD